MERGRLVSIEGEVSVAIGEELMYEVDDLGVNTFCLEGVEDFWWVH